MYTHINYNTYSRIPKTSISRLNLK